MIPLCLALLNITACGVPQSPSNSNKNLIDNARELARKAPDDSSFTVNSAELNKDTVKSKVDNPSQKKLFPNTLSTSEERIFRLENNVQQISDTLARMSPKITKLIDVENDLDNLTFQLEEIINRSKSENIVPAAQPASPTPAMQREYASKMAKPIQKTANSVKMEGNSLIHNLRIGDHPGKLRMVFETMDKVEYEIAIDNTENIMIVTFPEGGFNRNLKRIAQMTKSIQSINQATEGDGSSLIFELSSTTEKIKDFRIAPNKKNPYHRIVIDLVGAVHSN